MFCSLTGCFQNGTIDDLYLQIQIEIMINATLVTPVHFTGFEKQETFNGPEYLFYGSNCINYYRDMYENVISSYYRNIPDIKTCHDCIGDRIWEREIIVTNRFNDWSRRRQSYLCQISHYRRGSQQEMTMGYC